MHCCALLMCDFLNRELDIRHKEDPKSVKNNNNNKKGGGGDYYVYFISKYRKMEKKRGLLIWRYYVDFFPPLNI
jgi:hypothetical protein